MLRRVFVPLVLLAATPCLAESPSASDIATKLEGTWRITQGRNPGSSTDNYRGTVRMAAKENGVLALVWNINGTDSYAGIGFTNGRLLAAGYSNNSPFGLAIYDQKGDELVGAWTGSMTKGEIGTETLRATGAGTGIFKIVKGVEPNGATYTGEVMMEKKGDVYEMEWRIGESRSRGVGIRVGDTLVVGWTPGKDVGVVCYSLLEGMKSMEGTWTGLGGRSLGSERLER